MMKIRQFYDSLSFIMGIFISAKTVFVLKQDPSSYLHSYVVIIFISSQKQTSPYHVLTKSSVDNSVIMKTKHYIKYLPKKHIMCFVAYYWDLLYENSKALLQNY